MSSPRASPARLAIALALLLGAACGRAPRPAVTPVDSAPPTRPDTASPAPERELPPAGPSPASGPPAATSPAASPPAGSDQAAYEITESDTGRTFSYPVTSRFTLLLDESMYPRTELRVTCTSDDVLGPISNVPPVAVPRYAVRYEALKPGTCSVTVRAFVVTIQIVG